VHIFSKYLGTPTNVRCHHAKFSHPEDQAPQICAPLVLILLFDRKTSGNEKYKFHLKLLVFEIVFIS